MTTDDEIQENSQKYQSLRGFHDVLPDEYDYYTLVKKTARHRLRQAGFRRISTPIMEETALFVRAAGETTDIVEKEMFTMQSRSGKSMSLKPESTAGIVRAYIEHGMMNLPQPVQLYAIEPHFRYDRPQKGRYRQFHQLDFEVIGTRDASIDAQVILISYKFLKDLKILHHFSLQLNTLGNAESRKQFNDDLRNYFFGKERYLSEDLLSKLEKNPIRILDAKDEDVQILLSKAPKLGDYLDAASKEYYAEVKGFLDELGISYRENKNLVRGLDYYSDTVFEFWDKNEGAQNAVGGGGRYDGLVEFLGGRPTPAVGVAFGLERIVQHMKDEGIVPPQKDKIPVFVAQLGGEAKKKAMRILAELHDKGIHAVGAVGKASIKYQLEMANKVNADWAVLMGEVEVREKKAILRDMNAGTQEIVEIDEVVKKVLELVGSENLDVYTLGE
ncbi:histidine--tRNA ligase [Candidatus Peregrinibacteria bacterium]|nr:histidine--tRNA ligase [Candidatus Peregrinibacteria bacterium]